MVFADFLRNLVILALWTGKYFSNPNEVSAQNTPKGMRPKSAATVVKSMGLNGSLGQVTSHLE